MGIIRTAPQSANVLPPRPHRNVAGQRQKQYNGLRRSGEAGYTIYVVTNSFHGTAFSVIFHKDFYVEALQKDFKPNDRVESLLCLTGLDECKVKTLEDCRLNVSRDFNFADDQIRKQYIKTKQYFERVLNEDGRSF